MKVIKLEDVDSIKYDGEKTIGISIKNEYEYLLAEKMTKKLLEKGLINHSEYAKIMVKNRESFSPFLAEIMG